MNKKKIKLQVLDKIKELNLEPTPKWHFILKDWVVWAAFSISILIGAAAFSVSVFMLRTNDWGIHKRLDDTFIEFAFETLPYIWIVLFAAFIYVGYYNLRHTEKGYKYSLPLIVGVNLLATIILGYAFLGMGVAKRIDAFAIDRIPAYERLSNEPRRQIWTNPENGLLAGEIKKVVQQDEIILIDFKDNEWKVLIKTNRFPSDLLEEGHTIQTQGEKTGELEFSAEHIRPWQRNLPGGMKPKPMR